MTLLPDVTPSITHSITPSGAVLSDDRVYRYRLHRIENPEAKRVLWIMLNPSKADATLDDATIRRCRNFSRTWGFGGIDVANLFALRSTDPAILRSHDDPVGPENDAHLKALITAPTTGLVVCAWSNWGTLRGQDKTVLRMLADAGVEARCLAVNNTGQPTHPVRQRADLLPHTCFDHSRQEWLLDPNRRFEALKEITV